MKKVLLVLTLLLSCNMAFCADLSPLSQSYYDKAVNLYQAGNIDEAKANFYKVIVVEPNYADAYYNLAAIAENEGNTEKAAYLYKRVLGINANDYGARYRLGACLNSLNKKDEAINYLVYIPESAPEYKSVRILLNKIAPDKFE